LSPTNPTKDIPIETLLGRFLALGTAGKRSFRVFVATIVWTLFLLPVNWLLGTVFIDAGDLTDTNGAVGEVSKLLSVVCCLAIQFLVFWIADAMLLSRAFTLDLTRCRLEWPPAARAAAVRKIAMAATPTDAWLRLRLVAVRTECVAQLVWYPSIVLAAMGIAAFTVEFGQFHFASSPVALVLSAGVVVGSAVLLRRSAESLRTQVIELLENARSRALRTQSAASTEDSQLDHLIERVTDLSEGAFAPYSQQPLVRALIVPAASYGASLLLQTYHLSAP
jgi:membrane protein implicated in regulation of membrane protease activity